MLISRYRRKTRGPPLDRIDIPAEVPNGDYKPISFTIPEKSAATIRERRIACRTIRQNRSPPPQWITNNNALIPLFSVSTVSLIRKHPVSWSTR